MDPLPALDQATKRYRKTKDAHEQARYDTIEAAVEALRQGERPTDVIAHSPFTAAYIRGLARKHGISPAPPGPKRPE